MPNLHVLCDIYKTTNAHEEILERKKVSGEAYVLALLVEDVMLFEQCS